jgi:hypothetical protein
MVHPAPVEEVPMTAQTELALTGVEWIVASDRPLAIIISRAFEPKETEFITSPQDVQQVGFVKYPRGGTIARHRHTPLERQIVGTPETLLVRSGRVEVSLYDEDQALIVRRILEVGDVVVLLGAGHGFEMLEDTVLLEVKQGPYTGLVEKIRF